MKLKSEVSTCCCLMKLPACLVMILLLLQLLLLLLMLLFWHTQPQNMHKFVALVMRVSAAYKCTALRLASLSSTL